MKLYEFTLEVQDGENEYLLPQFVAASTDRLVARFVQNTAQNFRPHAQYDAKANLFQAREGCPTWRIGSIREVTEIVVPHLKGVKDVNELASRPNGRELFARLVRLGEARWKEKYE